MDCPPSGGEMDESTPIGCVRRPLAATNTRTLGLPASVDAGACLSGVPKSGCLFLRQIPVHHCAKLRPVLIKVVDL